MVCRENKGRSANIGIIKALHFATTGERIHDSELQSMQHQLRHEVEGVDAYAKYADFNSWPKEDQIAAWRDMLSSVDAIPADVMSDADKYRTSHKQPGVATRIKQEITRLETGVHEGTGKKLSADQVNSGADMLATMRMLAALERNTPARKNFLENNARRRGITFQDAEAEWNALMNRKGDFSQIKLTDEYRDSLNVAGVDAQDQANLGQSGRARSAMQIMEQRAQEHLASLGDDQRRDAMRPEHARGMWVRPDDPKAQLKCGACGQFGHDDASCPNTDHLLTIDAADELLPEMEKMQMIHFRRNFYAKVGRDGVQEYLDQCAAGSDAPDQGMTVDQWLAAIDADEASLRWPLLSVETAKRQATKAMEERLDAQQAIEDSGVTVSKWIKAVSYNPDNGLLQIDHHPYTKKDGSVSNYPSRYFRARPEQVEALLHEQSIGRAVHARLLDSNRIKDLYQFENQADLDAAKEEVRCPTCGRWASMNSNHRCPVPGGPSEEVDVDRRRRQIDYRAMSRAAVKNGTPVPEPPMQVAQALRHIEAAVTLPDPDDSSNSFPGVLRAGTSDSALAAMDAGKLYTSTVRFTAADDDCHVTGEVSAWRDDSGVQMISIFSAGGSRGLRCSCAQCTTTGLCKHVRAVGGVLKRRFQCVPVPRATRPGMQFAAIAARRADDAAVMEPERLGYAEIQQRRRDATNAYAWQVASQRKASKVPGQWVLGNPTNADGDEVEQPTQWERDPSRTSKPGSPVVLSDYRAVRARLRSLSQSKGGRGNRVPYSVTLDPDGSGAILINIPPSSMKSGKDALARQQRRTLAELMGVPEAAITSRGYRVSPNAAARHNALDRMAGDPPRIIPATVAYRPTGDDLRAAERRHRFGNDGSFVG